MRDGDGPAFRRRRGQRAGRPRRRPPRHGYKTATYAIAGLFYALAGVLLAGYLGVPSLLVGHTYLLPTITVVVLGGTSLLGGAGSVAATAIGAIFLVQLQQVIIGMGAPTSAQFIIQAVIILLGMALRAAPWRLGAGLLRGRRDGAGARCGRGQSAMRCPRGGAADRETRAIKPARGRNTNDVNPVENGL